MKAEQCCGEISDILEGISFCTILIDDRGRIQSIDDKCIKWCTSGEVKKGDILGVYLDRLIREGVFVDIYSFLNAKNKNKRFVVKIKEVGRDTRLIMVYNIDEICLYLSSKRERGHKHSGNKKTVKVIAFSKTMTSIVNFALRIAKVDSTVLITGESGVGKDLLARFIHFSSDRKDSPFVEINCASIPANLFETELFGYEGGAFSGARIRGKKGLFEVADGGTLFLNEIAELPLHMQAKLLSVIQEKKITRVGGVRAIDIDVRIIAATNKNLRKLVDKGNFREDLYYRLDVISIYIPPLRERLEDLEPLVMYILDRLNLKYGLSKTISPEVISYFKTLPWKGNIRELENFIEKLVLTSTSNLITLRDVNLMLNVGKLSNKSSGVGLKEVKSLSEKEMLLEALTVCKTTRQMAEYLGISQSSVVRKLKKYNLRIDRN